MLHECCSDARIEECGRVVEAVEHWGACADVAVRDAALLQQLQLIQQVLSACEGIVFHEDMICWLWELFGVVVGGNPLHKAYFPVDLYHETC